MPTGDEFVKLALKRFLSQNRMDENFFQFLRDEHLDLGARIFPVSGLFTYPVTVTPDYVGNTIDFTPDPIEGIDDEGHVIKLSGAARLQNIPFENTAGEDYWLGLKYDEIPSGVYNNPRTGVVEYDKIYAEVGERTDPDSVTDNLDGTITFNVNTLLQAGIDHGGRYVTVYLKNPISRYAAIAIETCLVSYAAPNNTILTVGSFGQSTISVNVADYEVALLGVTILNTGVSPTVNPFTSDYIVLGAITGGGPGSVDTGEQQDLSGGGGHTLQKAYDGLAGLGSGRNVTVNNQAIDLIQTNNAPLDKDVALAALRIDKANDTGQPIPVPPFNTEDWETAIDAKMKMMCNASLLHRSNLIDVTANDFLRAQEAVEVTGIGNTVDFSRAGVDLLFTALNASILPYVDMIELSASAVGNNGVYMISAVNATDVDLIHLDGSAVVLAAEVPGTLQAKIYRPLVKVGNYYGIGLSIVGLQDFARDDGLAPADILAVVPNSTADATTIMRLIREDGTGIGIDTEFQVRANGDVDTDGDIHSDLDISADGTIKSTFAHATDPAIEATAAANQGHIKASGNIDAGVDIEAGGSVIANSNMDVVGGGGFRSTDPGGYVNVDDYVHTVSGEIRAATYVEATTDVKAGSDFEYSGLGKQFQTRLGPEDGYSEWDIVANEANWIVAFSTDILYLTSQHYSLGGQRVAFPIRLPDNCVLDNIDAFVYSIAAGMELEFLKTNHDYATPAIDDPPTIIGTDIGAVVGGLDVLALTPGETIDNTSYRYYITIRSSDDADKIYDIRLKFTVIAFRPHAG